MSCPGFGELNIPSSRAFWDDCDEDEEAKQTTTKLELSFAEGQSETPIASDIFLLIEGFEISEFAEKTLLQDATKVADIPMKKSSLHRINTNNILLAILEEDLVASGEVTELLLPYAEKARQIITVTVKSKVDYKSVNISQVRDEITFLRGIYANLKNIEELQAPNFIAGVAAGVASWCYNKKLPVGSYVAYTDNVGTLDKLAAQPILKLLQDLGLKCASTYTPKLRDDSHLYS